MKRWLRILIRVAAVLAGVFLLVGIGLIANAWVAFGKAPTGERRDRMEASPQWDDGVFVNATPMWNDIWGSMTGWGDLSPHAEADPEQIPVVSGDRSRFATPPSSGLRVTWLGHSTLILELDGVRVLTDPVFGGRAAPFTWMGPPTWYDPPIPVDELPELDAVLISHDHYDHLQTETIEALASSSTTFFAPLGVGAHLAYWGVPEERIVEMDWWDEHPLTDSVKLVMTPSRHASGRQVLDRMRTLWAGYALIGPEHRVFFSGDTGLFDELADIGEKLGPFDVTMFEVGAYAKYWPDWHLGPENAVRAHELVRGDVLLPIHWGLWNLALHGWTEPAERTLVEVQRRGARAYLPKPGESFEPAALPAIEKWWPDLPWDPVDVHPIEPTGLKPETLRR